MKEKPEAPYIKETPMGPVTPGHYLVSADSFRRLQPLNQEDARFSQNKGIWIWVAESQDKSDGQN